jgi:hypothetical protein
VAAALTNTAWTKICAAAERKPAAADEARAALSKILFNDYLFFAYDRERVEQDRQQAGQMLEQLDTLAALYRRMFLPDLPANELRAILDGYASPLVADDVKTERDLWSIALMRRRALAKLLGAEAQQEANGRNKSEQRAFLYHWLCEVWLEYFEGPELPDVGPRRTPLVNFILAAMGLIMPKGDLPKPDTVRDNIERQRRGRASLRAQSQRRWGDAGFTPQK